MKNKIYNFKSCIFKALQNDKYSVHFVIVFYRESINNV